MPLSWAVPKLSHEKCVRVQATPPTIPEGLAIGLPMLDCYPSYSFCFGFLVNRASFLVPGLDEDVLDESCGSDVEDELVPEFDDNPRTTRGTKCSVLQRTFFPFLVRCGF